MNAPHRYSPDLRYDWATCATIRADVHVGYEADIDEDERGRRTEVYTVIEVWVGSVDIAAALTEEVIDELVDELEGNTRSNVIAAQMNRAEQRAIDRVAA